MTQRQRRVDGTAREKLASDLLADDGRLSPRHQVHGDGRANGLTRVVDRVRKQPQVVARVLKRQGIDGDALVSQEAARADPVFCRVHVEVDQQRVAY